MSLGRRTGFKTKLCPQYNLQRVCDNGDSCRFAHGKRELRAPENPLYKSQLCTAFTQSGTCQLEDDCLFAHDAMELRQDEEELEDQLRHQGGSGSDSGGSPLSASSQHHLQQQQLQQTPTPTRILSRVNENAASSLSASSGARVPNGSNTSLASPVGGAPPCHAFQRSGSCSRGANCQYSHVPRMGGDMSDNSSVVSGGYSMGGGQLNDNVGSKYKTALCHAFQKNNRCANGDNCRYAHGVAELQPAPEKAPPAPMDPNDPKYKTKLCIKFEKEKKCLAGDNCNFAHGIEELRNRSPEDEQKVSDRYKTSVCQIYLEKVICPRGPNCTYAHGRYELRPIGFKGDFEAKIAENPRWKCNLCKAWSETNRCKNGDECSYAHGEKELRSEKPGPPEVRRFKTELCKKLFTQGFCPQGSICTFAHCENDLQQNRNAALSSSSKTSPISVMGGMPNSLGYSSNAMFGANDHQNANSMVSAFKMAPGAGIMDRSGQMGMGNNASMHSPTMIGSKSAIMNRTGPNKDVEMFSDFLEFMKLKEAGVLDMLKHGPGMMPRHQTGPGNPPMPSPMSAGSYSSAMGGAAPFMGAQFSNAGGMAGPNPMDALGASVPGGVISLNVNGQASNDGRMVNSGMSNSGLMDFSSMGPSQMRKRKYEPF